MQLFDTGMRRIRPTRAGISQVAFGAALSPQLLLVLATLFWGGNFVVGRLVRQEITPLALGLFRWLLALLILLPLSAGEMRQHWRLLLAHWRLVVGLGATGIAAYTVFVYQALQTTSAVNAALVLATLPLVIVVMSWLINREPLRRWQLLGMAASLSGAIVIVARGDFALLLALRVNGGDLWMLAAVPVWAVYAVIQKRRPPAISPLTLVTASVCVGVLLLAPCYLWELSGGASTKVTAMSMFALVYTGVGASAIGYVLWNRGAAVVGPARAGIYINLIPVWSAALAVALLGEPLALYHLVGAALVASGILLARRSAAR